MSYSKCLGMGDPITSPSQVPSDLDLMWLNLDGGANPTTSTTTSGDGLTTTSLPVSTTADGTTVVQLMPLILAGVVAYFICRKK
jgi:hypothetical protein